MIQKNIVKKVQSLLALADKDRNSSDAEADLALSKAYELLAKYRLTLEEVRMRDPLEQENETIIEAKIDTKLGSLPSKLNFIVWILQDHFRIQCIYHTQRVNAKRQRFISFIGSESDVEIAKYIFTYLGDEFERRWVQHKKNVGAAEREKKGFMYGIYEGFDAKLKSKRRQTARDAGVHERSLMKNNSQIEDYIQKRYQKLGKQSMNWTFDTESYHDGIKAGESIRIRSAVRDDDSKGRLLQITSDL